jgi:hypothetical protein
MFEHNWSWPRKRGGKDVQVCLNCGTERESRVRFDGPRYKKTQDGIPNFTTANRYPETLRTSPAAAG